MGISLSCRTSLLPPPGPSCCCQFPPVFSEQLVVHTHFSLGARCAWGKGRRAQNRVGTMMHVLGQETWLQSGSLEGDSCL